MAGYQTRDPMIVGQRSHRYTDMSYTTKTVKISCILKLKLKLNEADEGQVGPGSALASTQNLTLTLTANLALILTANLTLSAYRFFSYRLFK